MKKFECHDCIGHCKVTIYRDYITPCSCMHNKKPVDWHEVKETVIDYSQWPKLTAEVFNYPECPTWANYAAVNKSGKGFYFQSEPEKTEHVWKLPPDHKMVNIGEFDPSDWENSLITRPPKEELPDWVKVDNMGWHRDTGYFKIIDVDDIEKRVRIQQMDGQTEKYCSFNTACTEVKYARPRPFNDKEMKELVGKIMTHVTGRYLITACTYFSTGDWKIEADGQYYSAERLLKEDFTIDGKPCYKFEHLNDKGEWVK